MQYLTDPIAALVPQEAARAKEKHGPGYASHNEAYGVLAEELQEAFDELNTAKHNMEHLLRYVRPGDEEGIALALGAISGNAIKAAAEAVQVAAVCQKWLDWMGGKSNA